MTSMEPSGLGPLGDVQVVAAMLRTDLADVRSLTRVLTGILAAALPADMIEVEHRRGLGARLAGRPGDTVGVLVHGEQHDLTLRENPRGGLDTEVRQIIGGVAISRSKVDLDTWLWILAETILATATRTAATQRALDQYVHSHQPLRDRPDRT
jgi:hypothetical protein